MRVIEKIEVSKLKYGCVVVTQNFLFNYSLFKIILNPSKKVEFSSENQKDMSVDGILSVQLAAEMKLTFQFVGLYTGKFVGTCHHTKVFYQMLMR